MNGFKEITTSEFNMNPFDLKSKWMLITALKDGKVNTMTANWGGFGVLWNKDIVSVVIRPQRYTKEFVDAADSFSLTFFDECYKKELGYLGKMSGRYEDKLAETSLTVAYDNDIPYFSEAETAIFAQKLYAQPMGGEYFIDKDIIPRWYPENDFHILYIGEVSNILVKD